MRRSVEIPDALPLAVTSTSAPAGLAQRVLLLAVLLALECLGVGIVSHPWITLHRPTILAIAFCAALILFGRGKLRRLDLTVPRVRVRWVAVHILGLALIAATDLFLLRSTSAPQLLTSLAIAVWFAAIAVLPLSLTAALFPLRAIALWLKILGSAWLYAALTALAIVYARELLNLAWAAPGSPFGLWMQTATFRCTRAILQLFYTGILSDPPTSLLGTAKFQVQIAGPCSGMEGLALMLVLSVGWLIFARRELRLARAVWLIPISLAAIWALNLVRIAALIAIGDAGHPGIAVGGFHSQAGWILFNAVALAFLLVANRLPWLHKTQAPSAAIAPASTNQAAIYLLPFLAILAASLLTQAASSGFEWLYPLRLVAALAVFWLYRRHYRPMDWTFGWLGPLAGVAVFALWLALSRASPANTALAAGLAALAPLQRTLWIVSRTLAAVLTVPLAEELAFRGYIARRLQSPDVESVPFRALTLLSILISSALFGLMHGRLWLAGILAGLAFAAVAKLRNRLGEAVAAHATANLLIAVWVLVRHDFSMW